MERTMVSFKVTVALDPVAGWGNNPADFHDHIGRVLKDTLGDSYFRSIEYIGVDHEALPYRELLAVNENNDPRPCAICWSPPGWEGGEILGEFPNPPAGYFRDGKDVHRACEVAMDEFIRINDEENFNDSQRARPHVQNVGQRPAPASVRWPRWRLESRSLGSTFGPPDE